MASTEDPNLGAEGEDLTVEETPGYKTPALVTLDQLQNLDQDDESLVKYKRDLLGDAADQVVIDSNNPSCVIIKKMELVTDGKDDLSIDLTKSAEEIKQVVFIIKEGVQYRIRISFYVQREIVTGLKYFHVVKTRGISVEKETYMVGSYGPRKDIYEFMTPVDEMPKGMIARGKYKVNSLFTDDDKNELLKWEWGFEVKKDWA